MHKYRKRKAGESRAGQSLTSDLSKTIRYVREHVVPDLKFQIHGEQGGA